MRNKIKKYFDGLAERQSKNLNSLIGFNMNNILNTFERWKINISIKDMFQIAYILWRMKAKKILELQKSKSKRFYIVRKWKELYEFIGGKDDR